MTGNAASRESGRIRADPARTRPASDMFRRIRGRRGASFLAAGLTAARLAPPRISICG
ncbi:conserved hypothetical protein [Burkholderia pseudomallei 668]|nr:conserved hypothetical protein [Burkholderia pseudomallei 668]